VPRHLVPTLCLQDTSLPAPSLSYLSISHHVSPTSSLPFRVSPPPPPPTPPPPPHSQGSHGPLRSDRDLHIQLPGGHVLQRLQGLSLLDQAVPVPVHDGESCAGGGLFSLSRYSNALHRTSDPGPGSGSALSAASTYTCSVCLFTFCHIFKFCIVQRLGSFQSLRVPLTVMDLLSPFISIIASITAWFTTEFQFWDEAASD
jgi:hypothetical protein